MKKQKSIIKSFKDIFVKNLGIKMIALVLALVLFILIQASEDASRSIMVEIMALKPGPKSKRVLVSEVIEAVKVTVSGPSHLIRRLNYSDISPAKIDLRNVQGGVFYFDEAMFDFPSGIKVLSISPAKLNLRYEPRIHKQVPIRANFRGKPKPMLSVQKVSLVPNRARISGPKSVISGISELKSEPIDVAILGPRRYKKRVNIALPHSEIISSSKVVTVSFEIAPKIVTKLFAKLPVKVLNTSMRVKLRPEKVDIVLQGPQQVIETLNPEMITPYLDAREETRKGQGTYRKTYIVSDLPDKVKVIEYRPSFVFITLSY